MDWRARTLADAILEAQAPLEPMAIQTMTMEEGAPPPERPPELRQRVQCPPCGRLVMPFEMVDVTSFPGELRGDEAFLCSACVRLWLRKRRVSEAEYLEALGAPPEVVAAAQAQEGHS